MVTKESIEVIAQSIGLSTLSPDVSAALAPDVEYRVREVMQEAIKCMRHARRTTLMAHDVDSALHFRNLEVSSSSLLLLFHTVDPDFDFFLYSLPLAPKVCGSRELLRTEIYTSSMTKMSSSRMLSKLLYQMHLLMHLFSLIGWQLMVFNLPFHRILLSKVFLLSSFASPTTSPSNPSSMTICSHI
jgi:transcription initiation factor TFIID subunit 6